MTPQVPEQESETYVRDELAATRTVLANERTILAYVRTALSLGAAGAFFVKFVQTPGMVLVGWILLPVSPALLLLGFYRFRAMKRRIRHECPGEKTNARSH